MPSSPTPPPDTIHRGDRIALRIIGALALAGAVVALVGSLASALTPLVGDGTLVVSLLTDSPFDDGANSAAGDVLPSGVQAVAAESAVVTLDAAILSGGALALLLIERALSGLVAAVVGASIGYTLLRIARGEAFHRSLFAVAIAVGATLSIGMMLATGLGGLGRMMAADELNTLLGEERFVPGFLADPTVVLIGFAVLGLAYVFRIGERLQHDTKGLV